MNLINHTACQNKYIHVHATPVYTHVHTYVILCSGPVQYMSTSSGYARVYTHAHACTAFCRQIRFEKMAEILVQS